MWTLVSIPPEVLEPILRELNAYAIGKLWFCGSTQLKKRLGSGLVRKFDLGVPHWHRKIAFPLLALSLPQLTDFRYEVVGEVPVDGLWAVGASLPRTLTRLELCYANTVSLVNELIRLPLAPFPSLTTLLLHQRVLTDRVNFANLFPSLQNLRTAVANYYDLENWKIPPLKTLDLSSLGHHMSFDISMAFLNSITDLSLGPGMTPTDFPSQLQRLVMPTFELKETSIPTLPRELAWLECRFSDMSEAMVKMLPPCLTHLSCSWTSQYFGFDDDFLPEYVIKELPRTLKILHIHWPPMDAESSVFLPPSLHTFHCALVQQNLTHGMALPASLTSLNILTPVCLPLHAGLEQNLSQNSLLFPQAPLDRALYLLPASLTEAEIILKGGWLEEAPLTMLKEAFSVLPLKLTSLSLTVYELAYFTWLKFPPQLTKLSLTVSNTETRDPNGEVLEQLMEASSGWEKEIPLTLYSFSIKSTVAALYLFNIPFFERLSGMKYLEHLDMSEVPLKNLPTLRLCNLLPKQSLASLALQFAGTVDWEYLNFSDFGKLRDLRIKAKSTKIYHPHWLDLLPPKLTHFVTPAVTGTLLPAVFDKYFFQNRIAVSIEASLSNATAAPPLPPPSAPPSAPPPYNHYGFF
jgi:hypothetical protein